MAENIFGTICNEFTINGISSLKLSVANPTGGSINFPIDFVLSAGTTSVIVGTDNESAQELTIGSDVFKYITPDVRDSSVVEEQSKDRRGKYYTTTISFRFQRVDLYTINQIKEFLFKSGQEFSIANAIAVIKDNNGVDWIMGYELPLVVQDTSDQTGGDDNFFEISLISRSYSRMRRFAYL